MSSGSMFPFQPIRHDPALLRRGRTRNTRGQIGIGGATSFDGSVTVDRAVDGAA